VLLPIIRKIRSFSALHISRIKKWSPIIFYTRLGVSREISTCHIGRGKPCFVASWQNNGIANTASTDVEDTMSLCLDIWHSSWRYVGFYIHKWQEDTRTFIYQAVLYIAAVGKASPSWNDAVIIIQCRPVFLKHPLNITDRSHHMRSFINKQRIALIKPGCVGWLITIQLELHGKLEFYSWRKVRGDWDRNPYFDFLVWNHHRPDLHLFPSKRAGCVVAQNTGKKPWPSYCHCTNIIQVAVVWWDRLPQATRSRPKFYPIGRLLETFISVLFSIYLYELTVTYYGDFTKLADIPWTLYISFFLEGFIAAIVQVCSNYG
jgi:hypothetical protein